jgi:arsenate reductase
MSTITLFGIRNCDTMKKAFAWLDLHGVTYDFHDYKKLGIDPERLAQWEFVVGWKALLNIKGMTWRRLPAARQQGIDRDKALALMAELPTLIRRPVLELDHRVVVGFDADTYADLISGRRPADSE